LSWWVSLLIFFTNLMHRVLWWMHSLVPSYGLCILLLTVLVRGMMFPLSRKQAQMSMRMQALMPEIKKLQEKYKNDRQQLGMAQMELYRKHGVNPLGSCWVLLLQMPIFLGLYYALQESIDFRLAEFLWIKNLAAPDMLFSWTTKIPWISRPEDYGSWLYLGPYFNLLPVIAVTLMIMQQKFLMPPPTDEQQEMQQKMMKYMMIFMGIVFYKVAAGLCIYFIISSLWGLAERQLLPKAKPAAAAAPPSPGGSSGRAARTRPRGPKVDQTNGTFKKVQDLWAELLKQARKK
jgi:YidC/Oxa1 family membrane protein insertase